jgi:phosphopantothenoylcysteine decarboxylase / phosphopantothenate---cysteine ligase
MAFVGIGVTGGIGAYKAVEVVRLLQQRGHRVQAVMTRTARRFVGPPTFEAITREPVITNQFARGLNADIEHIALASEMDALVVAPATANIVGKFANGIADDFLTALYLATRAPVLVAPAMNTNMWTHPAVQENLDRLRKRGVHIIDPGDGYLACGWVGAGRLAEPPVIAEAVDRVLGRSRTLAGRRVLVTAGPTIEDIDAVRFLGNRSSGRMGFAVAEEAHKRGAEVVLVAGPTSVDPPAVGEVVRVRSAHEMHRAVIDRASAADVVVMAAAVADYTPAGGRFDGKIEKGEALSLALERTPDILADLGRLRGNGVRPVLVGFAAQAGDPVDGARRKLERKAVDLVVANDITQAGAGFESPTNQVTFVDRDGIEPRPFESKTEAARAILDRVERLLGKPATETALSK